MCPTTFCTQTSTFHTSVKSSRNVVLDTIQDWIVTLWSCHFYSLESQKIKKALVNRPLRTTRWHHWMEHLFTPSVLSYVCTPVSYTHLDVYKRQILHVDTKGRKLDTLEQLEIYKHTKTNKNDILNEQTQFKSHALFEHISPHTHTCLLYTSRCV